MEKPILDYDKLPELVERIQSLVVADVDGKRFRSPIGVVHGDLNYANVMVEKGARGMDAAQLEELLEVGIKDFPLFLRAKSSI